MSGAGRPVAGAALVPGDPSRVGRYRLIARLGAGGMGVVYLGLARDGRRVAVKVLRPELAGNPEFRARFRREVATLVRVKGLCTVRVIEADTESPRPFLVTEYAAGPTLAEYLSRHGPLSVGLLYGLATGLAEALAAIHAAGIVHRDLKPSNVILTAGAPKVIDFGIAHATGATAVTRTGVMVGTVGFMAPEQVAGRAGQAADIFAWAVTIGYAASGRQPFGTGEDYAVLYRVLNAEPDVAAVPGALRPLVEAAMAKNPEDRPTAQQLLDALTQAGTQPGGDNAAATRTALSRTWRPVEPLGQEPDTRELTHRRPGWHLSRAWAVATLAAVAVLVPVPILISHRSVPAQPPASTPINPASASGPATVPGPGAVVEAFYAAINDHNWPRVWQLGGKNLGTPYQVMIVGYSMTARDVIISLSTNGAAVAGSIFAYQTTGVVRTYQIFFVVQNGAITAGHQTLLGIGYPSAGPATPGT